jgi:RIO kinase 2
VSSAEKAASLLPSMNNREIRILQIIELGMIQHEIVPYKDVIKYSNFPENETKYHLNKLHSKNLVYRQMEPYLGYIMNYTAYDILGLNALVQGNYLDALGASIGIGKESDVFEALDPNSNQVAVKFHRLGRTSFRETRRKREYLADRRHTSWLYQSRLAAEKEFEALNRALKAEIAVPRPIHRNRHIIVMEFFLGIQLSKLKELSSPRKVLNEILENVKKAYKAGLIHTDLSEFNVLLNDDNNIMIIDWPQYTGIEHPNANEILERDVGNILNYFNRKFNTKISLKEIIEEIMS